LGAELVALVAEFGGQLGVAGAGQAFGGTKEKAAVLVGVDGRLVGKTSARS
jgi:hypothetical protein